MILEAILNKWGKERVGVREGISVGMRKKKKKELNQHGNVTATKM
jgi:hypothetical protein